ncbi:MAG: hypothetical protein HY905_07655 [Deltaproteobacteria bacterium]|nr:hypothetical protein [Deltaproteobacteria bacterium]
MTRLRFPGWLICALLPLAACQEQGTEIVFEVSTGYLVPEQVNAAEIVVVGLGPGTTPDSPDACPFNRALRLGPGQEIEDSTFTFAVRAGAVCNERVLFKVTLIKDALDVVVSSGTAEFVPGNSIRVAIDIPRNTTCDSGQQWCDRACTDSTMDLENCGWCGNSCRAGLNCIGGWCRCPDGQDDCGGVCIDTDSDPDNCGGCGAVCSGDQVCIQGECRSQCEAPLILCDRRCIDPQGDPRHCGSCTNDCGADARCQDGVCNSCRPIQGGQCDPIRQCGCSEGMRCDAAQEPYYGPQEICVPAGSSPAGDYCDLAYACAPGLGCFRGVSSAIPLPAGGGAKIEGNEPGTCLPWCLFGDPAACDGNPETCRSLTGQLGLPDQYGVCLPFPSLEVCNWIDDDGFNGPDDGVDVMTDWMNCGSCFHACNPGEACVDGLCQSCMPPYLDCGAGWCTDTSYDPLNCGGCGNLCPPNQACIAGSCVPDCAEVLPLCPDSTGTPQCTNVGSDPDHCGYCEAEPCPAGQACVDGNCSAACPAGQAVCDRRCADVATDPGNCSGCGDDCGSGHDCVGGTCESCSPGPRRSGGDCYVPTQCGCADGEACVLQDDGTGNYVERCSTPFGGFRELAPGCHITLADCEPGLQCIPTDIPAHINRCFRLCTTDAECSSGKCLHGTSSAPFDPYGVCRAVGGPCGGDWDCPGESPICLTGLGADITVPDGYCTFLCDPFDDQCPVGSRCVEYRFGRFGAACMATCSVQEDCRDGYNCARFLGDPGVCFPALAGP